MSELEETFHGQLRYAELLEGMVREHRFATSLGRQWRFDFCWPAHQVAVELQGGIFRYDPSHTSVARMKGEMEKLNAAALLGWRVFTFHTDDVEHGIALNQIEAALHAAAAGGVPSPPREHLGDDRERPHASHP